MRFGLFLNTSEFASLRDHGAVLDAALSYADAAERVGLNELWVSEHHFIPFGVCSSALTLAGFLLGRCPSLRVGTAVTLVHLYHPVQLAEQVALLDQVSGGRLDFGIGRGGYLKEVEVFGINRARHGLEVEASLDVLLNAWTSEQAESDNPLFPFGAAAVGPRPRTQPHPPLFIASSTPSTVERAARDGLPLLMYWAMQDDQRVKVLEMYREAAERHGRDPDAVEHVVTALAYIDDDSDRARATVDENLRWSFMAGDHAHVPARTPRHNPQDREALPGLIAGAAAVGAPELCAERLLTTIERTGARRLSLLVEAGADPARTLHVIERLAGEVLPAVRRGLATEPASVIA